MTVFVNRRLVFPGFLIACFVHPCSGQTLTGQVTDPSGAAVPAANVSAISSSGTASKTAVTDREGRYRFDPIEAGNYAVHAAHPGFANFVAENVSVAARGERIFDIRMRIGREGDKITVTSDPAGVDLDPTRNAGQIVLSGSDLDALSDDPDDLAKDLQALAGPSPGSDAPDFFIDGFTGGRMPPKSSIREIRVNQNPFSAEFDRVGFGRIEISTKPGSDHYHGQGSFDFADRALTARNPYFTGATVPNYEQIIYAGNVSGPLTKKSSFFIDSDRRIVDENSLLSYTTLDSNLKPVTVSGAIVAPTRRFSVSPRVDYALTPSNTLALRYSWTRNSAQNQGISTQAFDQASQGYSLTSTEQSVQGTDTAILGSKAVNDTRFQFLRTAVGQQGVSSAPQIEVQGAFTGGGTFPLNYTNRNRYEFQNYTTLIHGLQIVKFGARLRDDRVAQQTLTDFNGEFIFSGTAGDGESEGIDVYRQNQLLAGQGLTQAQIAAQGFGPSEFLITTGKPLASVSIFDAGVFVQDDWRLRRNLTLSGGLRYETQSGISTRADLAPRLGLAWSPLAKTVVRAGAGIFFDRFTSDLELKAAQLNGVNQTQYIVQNPTFYPNVPDFATILAFGANSTSAVYQADSHLHVPRVIQTAAGLERQLPHNISLAINYTGTRGVHQLLTRDINAPLPTVFNSSGEAAGPRPYGNAAGNIYQYEGSGVYNQKQTIVSSNARVNRRFTLYGYYVYGRAMSDTDGPNYFPNNPYNLREDYGRAAFDVRNRGFVSGNITAPLGIRFAPFIFLQSGMPYNITTGQDANGDGNPNDDRPAFAQDLTRPSVVSKPGIGVFDTEPNTLPGAAIVPRNYPEGPGILLVTVRVSRTWTFGESGRGGGNSGTDEIRGGGALNNGGLSSQASSTGGVATAKRYALTLNATVRNVLNNVNPALPIGNLSSPLFGKSVALSTYGPLPGAGANAAGGNRHIELQLRLTF